MMSTWLDKIAEGSEFCPSTLEHLGIKVSQMSSSTFPKLGNATWELENEKLETDCEMRSEDRGVEEWRMGVEE